MWSKVFFFADYACPGNQFEISFNWLSVSIEQFEIISIKENGHQNTKFLSEKNPQTVSYSFYQLIILYFLTGIY